MLTKVLILFAIIAKTLQDNPCTKEDSVDISSGKHLSNGDIVFNDIKYSKGEYYLDDETKVARGCICKKKICLKKCCPFGLGYNTDTKQCQTVSDAFDPAIYDEYERVQELKAESLFNISFGKPTCDTNAHEFRVKVSRVSGTYHLRKNGNLYIEIPTNIPPWFVRTPDKYCIDTFIDEDTPGVRTTRLDALVCFTEDKEDHHYLLSASCMLISCVFILATVAVYAWLPELHNLHGWVLIAYLLSFFVGFSFLATMQILLTVDDITSNACIVMTFIIYFFLLSAFFWLNVMCFDIWWTFSGKRGMSLGSNRARFQAYSLYAFGFPTALTILMASLEFSGLPAHPLLPRLRDLGCFLYGRSKLLYLYGPIVVLCVANLIFFTLTALKIARINHQTSVLKSKESATHDKHRNDKQRLLLYVKLFAVMGINWILEVVSSLYPELNNFWCYTDAYNVLIGVIIFVIFVCKRKIFRLIKKRYKQVRGENSMSRTQTSSSRTCTSRDDVRMSSIKA